MAALCDYTLLLTTAKVIGWPTPICAMVGVSVGASVNFLLNRRLAFRDSRSSVAGAALRYVAAIGCLMILHATAVGVLTDRLEVPIVLSKLISDVTLLAGGQLLILRYVVFPRNKSAPSEIPTWPRTSPRASSSPINS